LAAAVLLASICGCRGISSNGGVPAALAPHDASAVTQRFGMTMHDAIHHWPSVTFGYWRVWDANASWPYIETARGVYDFSLLDQYVDLAQQHNIKMIYDFGNTPKWASRDPATVGTQGLPGATAPPVNMQDWQDYVNTTVKRYKGRIYAYEIWNEVDLPGYWTASMGDMLNMVKVAYTTIKQIDPAAIVLAPSLVAGNGIKYLKDFFNAGGAQYSDAVAFHLYDIVEQPEQSIENFYIPATQTAAEWGKQVWDTEVGWGPWGTFPSEQDEAAFTARTLILQAASGINVIVWFAWDDRGPWVHIYFVGPDFQTPTLSAMAFQQVQGWLADSAISCSNTPDGTWQCPVVPSSGKTKYIVWNMNGPDSFAIPASWNIQNATDLTGQVSSVPGGSVLIGTSPILLNP
jgi:hypothetical protein